jgi:superoxide dismutase, Cu-Zn family
MSWNQSLLCTAVLAVSVSGAQSQQSGDEMKRLETLGRPAIATLAATAGNQARGTVTFAPTDKPDKVKVQVHLENLSPGSEHGLHIHVKGDCSAADASSAGDHFNPEKQSHGAREGNPRHAGDLGNVKASSSGVVSETFDVSGIKIGEGANGILGRSVILHAKTDDLKSQPAGDSGARIACGAIAFQTKDTRAPRL